MDDLCEHGDIPAACMDCLDGTPKTVPKPVRPRATSAPFPSRFRGCCEVCEDWWSEGVDIVRVGDDGWAHADCAEPRR